MKTNFNILCCLLMILLGCKNSSTEDERDDIVNQNSNHTKWAKIEFYPGTRGTLGLKSDGTLWAWGSNTNGEIGLGSIQESLIPVKVLDNVNDFAGAFALKKDGTLWGTGRTEKSNFIGFLCNGGQQSLHCYAFTNNRLQFQQVGSDANWNRISGDYDYILLQKNDGYTYGWGFIESPEDQIWGNQCGAFYWYTPHNSRIRNYSQISKYKWMEYSRTQIGIKDDGTLWHFPLKYSNQQTPDPRIPTQYGTDKTWKSISPRNPYTLMKADGSVWVWDDDNKTATRIGTENWKMFCGIGGFNYETPNAYKVNFGIKKDGTLWSWGNNNDGFLGTGNYISSNIPVKLSQESNWEYIYAESDGTSGTNIRPTIFIINSKGEVWGWGSNIYGQLGDGTKVDRYTPTLLQKSN